MRQVSEAMIRAAFAAEPELPALLATFVAGAEIVRVTTWPGQLDGGGLGLVSAGLAYQFAPFTFSAGGSGDGEAVRGAKFEVASGDGRLIAAAKTVPVNTQAKLTIQTVRPSAPDVVEIAMVDGKVVSVEADLASFVANVLPRDFAGEPACCARYTAGRTPGLF